MGSGETDSSLTVREAADFLSAHIETVRRLARRGAIPSFKVGKDWRFRKEALVNWSRSQGQGPAKPSGRIIIVDDELNVCQVLAAIVGKIGFQPVYSTRARDALELVSVQGADMVLLDLQMPEMNGPEFLRELRKTHPDLPVVIVTGHPDGKLMQDAAEFPPLMLLPKPFSNEQVRQTVCAVLGCAPTVRPACAE